jgi:hypothetical protein
MEKIDGWWVIVFNGVVQGLVQEIAPISSK